MGEKDEDKDLLLTRKGLERHIIKTIVISVILAVLGGAGTAFAFYYKANNQFENLHKNDARQDESINKMTSTLNEINTKLGTTKTSTAVSDEKIKGLEKTINMIQETQVSVQKNQTDILKMLGEIRRNQ